MKEEKENPKLMVAKVTVWEGGGGATPRGLSRAADWLLLPQQRKPGLPLWPPLPWLMMAWHGTHLGPLGSQRQWTENATLALATTPGSLSLLLPSLFPCAAAVSTACTLKCTEM